MALLGVRDTARELNVHENTIRNWVQAGFITPAQCKPDGSYMKFEGTEVERVRRALQRANEMEGQDEPAGGAVVGVIVRLTSLPAGMTPRQAVQEVAASVQFGKPEVYLQFVRRRVRS